jgi:hypothetical protein
MIWNGKCRSAKGVCLVYKMKEKRPRAQTAGIGERFQVAVQGWNEGDTSDIWFTLVGSLTCGHSACGYGISQPSLVVSMHFTQMDQIFERDLPGLT